MNSKISGPDPTHYEASRRVVNSKNETTYYLTVDEARQLDCESVDCKIGFYYKGVHYLPIHLKAADVSITQTMPTVHINELLELCSPSDIAPRQPKATSKVGHVLAGVAVGIVITLSAWSAGHESGMRAGVKAGVLAGARTVLAAELCDRAAEVCK